MQLQEALFKTKILLLDMDGTIYLDDTPIGPMQQTLQALRNAGKRIIYCTNNSSKTADEYEEKLKRIGLWADGDAVYTSGMATCSYLNEFYPEKSVYLVATDRLKAYFAENGVVLTDETQIADVAVLAYDTTLTFEKLKAINKLIRLGKPYIATHGDEVCPSKDVDPPDVGSFIQLLKCSAKREPDLICGKPYAVMGDRIAKLAGVQKDEIMMVGDRLHTDIRFGVNNRFFTLLVYSGETTPEMAATSPDRADFALPSLNELVAYL